MSHAIFGTRVNSVQRIIALGASLLLLAGCADKSTAPAVATSLSVTSGTGQVGTVATSLAAPIVIHVTDQSGNSIAGALVTLTPGASSGTVATSQSTTDANGLISITWTLGTVAGADTLVASLGAGASTTIVATANAGAAAQITIVAGNDQTGVAGSVVGTALAVRVTDAFGNPVANATVQWSDSLGGILAASTTVTDSTGLAVDGFTLPGATSSVDSVTATVLVNGAAPIVSTFTEDTM